MKPWLNSAVFVLLIGLMGHLSCRKEYSCENGCGANRPPVANAGNDTLIILPTDSVFLDGTASTDPDGNINSFQWTRISGPATLTIAITSTARTIVKNLELGAYQFELKVTDDEGLNSLDTVNIAVVTELPVDHSPIANAGADQSITWPFNMVNLDASGSSDPDNDITEYTWTKIFGPSSFTIALPNAIQTQVTNLTEGKYQFELTVKDAGGLISKDTMQVTVFPFGTSNCDISNRPVVTAQLTAIGKLSEGRFGVVAASVRGKILFAGGISPGPYSTRVDIYEISTNSWAAAELSQGRQGMTVATVGNKILFAGGGDDNAQYATSRVDIYDASTNNWSTAELSEARSHLASATLGNKVFFAGGGIWNNNYFAPSDRVDIYDNATNTWTIATLSEARSGLSSAVAGNKIFFAGGSNEVDAWNISKRIDIYDGNTNSWSTSSLNEGKMFMGNIAVGNKIYWAAGINSPLSAGHTESDQVEIRDVNTLNSTYACIFPKSKFNAVLKDNRIVFFTGYQGYPNQFDIYNTANGIWSVGILNRRVNGAAIISVNNVIYIAGGTVDGTGYSDVVWKLEF